MVVAVEEKREKYDVLFNKEAFLLALANTRRFAAKHAAERPLIFFVALLLLSSCALPLVIIISLSPLVILSSFTGYALELGMGNILYFILMQGSSLMLLLVALSVFTYSGIVTLNIVNVLANSPFVQKRLLKK